ncbi:hypothetical protein [Moorena producens]
MANLITGQTHHYGLGEAALPPQDRTASPRPRCIAVPCSLPVPYLYR